MQAVSARRLALSARVTPRAIVPEKTKVTLRFQEYVTMASGANSYAYQTYSMNSAFDPLYSIGGGTCTGFTEWMTLYTRFYVSKCMISTTFYNGGTDPTVHYQLALRSDDAVGGVAPTLDKILEGRDCRFTIPWIGAHPSNGRALSVTYYPSKFQGLPAAANREELSGDVATDPNIQPAVQCGFYLANGAVQKSNAIFILIEYTTTFFRPRLLGDI